MSSNEDNGEEYEDEEQKSAEDCARYDARIRFMARASSVRYARI